MDYFKQTILSKFFYKSPVNPSLIGSRESTILEFKESFNFSNLGEYAKAMASFANKEGGYIIFGIKDSPRQIKVYLKVDYGKQIDAYGKKTHFCNEGTYNNKEDFWWAFNAFIEK